MPEPPGDPLDCLCQDTDALCVQQASPCHAEPPPTLVQHFGSAAECEKLHLENACQAGQQRRPKHGTCELQLVSLRYSRNYGRQVWHDICVDVLVH